ncbi:phospholipase D family protein [Chlamydia ibidis]|uniref:phospholipase D n=2 Tax=Chlamydia ibidis TaxID=1405396 RepID=S7J5K4_9CHLA|nr:phospholipase D family protein [Chlamydia ibidis]EQM62562.1 phospholipase D family protein [Chlamydia ibidis 10-1398/6]
MCDSISKAQNKLFLRVFCLSCPKIISAINEQCQKSLDTTIYCEHIGHFEGIKNRKNVLLVHTEERKHSIMHEKWMGIDRKLVFVGSANFSRTSLEESLNLIVTIYSEQFYNAISQKTYASIIINHQSLTYFPLPKHSDNGINKIIHCINSARKSIKIAMFNLSHRAILSTLTSKCSEGLEVKIVIDHSKIKEANDALSKIANSSYLNVMSHKSNKCMHHKFALIDASIFIFGSVNWTTRGLTRNSENLIIIEDLRQEQLKKIENIWEKLSNKDLIKNIPSNKS